MSPLPVTGMAVSAALTEAFNLTGKLPLRVDETIVPVVTIGDLGDSLWGPTAVGTIGVAAGGVGMRSQVELSLPQVGSAQGAAAIIDRVDILGEIAGAYYTFGASPGLAAPNLVGLKDWADNGQPGAPSMLINAKNNGGATAGFMETLRYAVAVNDTYSVYLGWILRAFPPTGLQQGLMIRAAVDNQIVRLNVFWRERVPR